MSQVSFEVAEVLAYDTTYQYVSPEYSNTTVNQLFALKVATCSTYFDRQVLIAKPANMNIKNIPLIGEYVLIMKTFNQEATSLKWRECWYYLSTIDIQSSINSNVLPGLSSNLPQESIDASIPGNTFQPKIISAIQPYEGDITFEGRWGNSIRFGSTVALSDSYTKNIPWRGAVAGDPIIVISNGQINYPSKQFTVENIETDNSSIYLTSTQTIPNFKLNNTLTIGGSESGFAKSQFIGIADRVILKAKTDVIILDSQLGIELNAPFVNIGTGGGKGDYEAMLQGPAVVEVLRKIIQVITSGFANSAGDTVIPLLETLNDIDLTQLTSTTIQLEKWTPKKQSSAEGIA